MPPAKGVHSILIYLCIFCTSVVIILKLFSWENEINVLSNPKHIKFKTIYPEPNSLLNINNFEYLLNNRVCYEINIKGIIIVTSYAGDAQGRSAHRRALPKEQLWDIGFKRVFLLAKIPSKDKYAVTQNALYNENERFNDIVQGNFEEAYRNLTYKHMMGLRWVLDYCKHAEFVIKMDDDIVVDIYGILNILNKKQYPNMLLMGYVMKNMVPIRKTANKWYVTPKEYPLSMYPTFLSGWLYITNPYTVKKLVDISKDTNFFWIDDTYITGILAKKLNIQHQNLNKFYTVHPENIECCIRDWINYKYKCDFLVCPNGNDFNLFVRFTKLSLECSKLNHCSNRPDNRSVEETCITQRKTNSLKRGKPVINVITL